MNTGERYSHTVLLEGAHPGADHVERGPYRLWRWQLLVGILPLYNYTINWSPSRSGNVCFVAIGSPINSFTLLLSTRDSAIEACRYSTEHPF